MRATRAAAIAAVVGALIGCGGGGRRSSRGEAADFDCRERRASYLVTGSLAGPERGRELDCTRGGPHLDSWTVAKDGTRTEDARSLSPGEFDALWKKIEALGWRNLKDCDQAADPGDPIVSFDVKDWNGAVAFACPGRTLPHPYNVLVDELDLVAAGYE